LLLAAALLTSACGDDDDHSHPRVTPTATAMVVATATPTPTHEHEGPPHSIMLVGSTATGGGALGVDAVPPAYVVASACLGGTDEACTGGTVVYTGTSPGFDALNADDPALPLYVLPDGVEVTIELTALDPDTSLLISETLLNRVGQTAVVNTTPHLHNHPTWQMVAPGGAHPEPKQLSFRLHAPGYAPSEETSVTLSVFEEDDHDHGGDDDDHDDE